ncbi:MAG: SAM-dependent methyltransferase [Bacteroidetes bacterium 4484_249]|nr:MAG: SAM-dependent methyltransferase [Bacteroidetes bacterium 4484_249]
MKKGKLYLIPSFLSESEYTKVFPANNLKIIESLDEFIVEEIRTARRFLRKIGFTKSFDKVEFHILNKHTELSLVPEFLNNIDKGKSIGLLSEAGTPCVADPGAEIVKMAHYKNTEVVPLVGPSSILLALMASGFNGQNFTFHGYLPIDKKDRIKNIKVLEQNVFKLNQTQIFIETPYRNNQMFRSIIDNCSKDILLCIACNITSNDEGIKTKTIAQWKKSIPDLHKKPVVFLLYK